MTASEIKDAKAELTALNIESRNLAEGLRFGTILLTDDRESAQDRIEAISDRMEILSDRVADAMVSGPSTPERADSKDLDAVPYGC